MKSITTTQLHILQHSLGVDQFGLGSRYRNRFVTGPESDDFQNCVDLCGIGLMHDHGPQQIAGGDHCFQVTDEGVDCMKFNSPIPPKASRARQRYLQFLDADCGLSFGEWLKCRHGKHISTPHLPESGNATR